MFSVAGELDRLLVPARRPHLGAEQDARALGVDEDLGEAVDVVGVADALRRCAVLARPRGITALSSGTLPSRMSRPISRYAGPGRAGHRLAEGHRDHVGDALGRHDVRGELRDRRHHVDVRQVLQGAHLVLVQGALAADQQERALGAQRVGDAGDGVGRARAGGDDGTAGLAGDARVGVGGVRGDLLVADVDDLDALVDAAVVDVDDVAAAEGVDDVDPLRLQGLRDQVAAGDHLGLGPRRFRFRRPRPWGSSWHSRRAVSSRSLIPEASREAGTFAVNPGGRPCAARGRPGSARGRARGARRGPGRGPRAPR